MEVRLGHLGVQAGRPYRSPTTHRKPRFIWWILRNFVDEGILPARDLCRMLGAHVVVTGVVSADSVASVVCVAGVDVGIGVLTLGLNPGSDSSIQRRSRSWFVPSVDLL